MAIEIAIKDAGKDRNNWKQAIFITESELDGSLSEVRTIIAKQGIEVPQDYRFLSLSGNVIPWAVEVEDTLVLRVLLRGVASSASKSYYDRNEENAVKSEISDSDDVKTKIITVPVPELWIVSNGSLLDFCECDSDDGKDNEIGGSGSRSNHEHQNAAEEKRNNMAMYGHLCPWKFFVKSTHDGNGPRNLFKLMFFIVALLFLLLTSLVLTTHVVSLKILIRKCL